VSKANQLKATIPPPRFGKVEAVSINIREIAKRAKVSTATVSRTFNRIPTVDPRLAKRVWKVIDDSGYKPNIQARALVSGRSHLLGLVVSEITNPFFPEIIQAFENLAVEHGYEILLSTVHGAKRMDTSVRRMTERRVEGIAVMTSGMEDLLIEDPQLRNVPLVFVDVGPKRSRVSNIRVDYLHGIRQALQHLAALRHDKIDVHFDLICFIICIRLEIFFVFRGGIHFLNRILAAAAGINSALQSHLYPFCAIFICKWDGHIGGRAGITFYGFYKKRCGSGVLYCNNAIRA
jgi:hypothetical protein